MVLDAIDQRILARLQASARIPLSTLAKEVGRSRTATQARLERLERTGHIRGYHAMVGYGDTPSVKVGTIILVYLHSRLTPEPVIARLVGVPEVIGCYRVTGDADLVVTIGETSRDRLEEICDPIWRMPEVRTTETILVLKRYIETTSALI